MIITDSSLSKISRLLIDKRIFDSTKINTAGTINIINGIAGGFNKTSYLFKKELEFSNTYKSFEIQCNGTYAPTNPANESCLWSLFSTDKSSSLYLSFLNNTVSLYKDNTVILSLNNLAISETNDIQATINFYDLDNINFCSITLIINDKAYTDNVQINESIDFHNLTTLNLGFRNSETDNFWQGNIDIPSFAIRKDNVIEYTPSVKNIFHFTKLMISDGSVPLTDDSVDLTDHVYSCEITEISRNNNNVLLTAKVGENIQIALRELGLYFTDDNPIDEEGNVKEYLFSSIKDISLKKDKNIEYNLIIYVNLDINVVNTVAFPEIVVKKGKTPHKSDFKTIQQVFTYITTNMERMIKTNALGIGQYNGGAQSYFNPASTTDIKPVGVGYDYAQMWYRFLKDISLFLDNSDATNNYGKLLHNLSSYIKSFNPKAVEIEGNTLVYEDGTINSFSTNSYVKSASPYVVPAEYEWNYETSFKTGSDVSTQQYIANFSNETIKQPLLLGISEGKCFLSLGAPDKVKVEKNGSTDFYYRTTGSTSIEGLTFYPWYTRNNIFGYNPHVELIGNNINLNEGVLRGFSGLNFARTQRSINPLNNSWELTIQFRTGYDTININPIICDNSVSNFKLWIENQKLNLVLQGMNPDTSPISIFNGVVNNTYSFEPLTTYTITIAYDTTDYTISVVNEDTEESSNIFTHTSPTPVLLADSLVLGSDKTSHGFGGSINLANCNMTIESNVAWRGLALLDTLYTRTYDCTPHETDAPIFYDAEGYAIPSLEKIEAISMNFIDKQLFNVKPDIRYYLKIHYFYSSYSVEYSTDGIYYIPVFQGNYTGYLLNSSDVYYGIAKINNTFEKPFLGSIFLQNTSFKYYIKDSLEDIVETNEINYLTSKNTETKLLDYFHIPTYAYDRNLITINNLNDETSKINIFEGTLKGGKDSIDFALPKGFSLAIKFLLNTQEAKLILAKGDLNSEQFYFTLEQSYRSSADENNELIFSLFMPSGELTLKKELTVDVLEKYTKYPITVTITCDGNEYSPEFKMYINTNLVASYSYYQQVIDLAIAKMYLTNRLSYESELTEDQIVQDILSFEGALTEEEILFINTILGTNS